ncbi:MAG TPA: ATP-binding protein [Bacteroidia bacterium]|nr:ATP-binding protein [Bacteroidia bacterium]
MNCKALGVVIVFILLFASCKDSKEVSEQNTRSATDLLLLEYQEQFFNDVKTGPHEKLDSIRRLSNLTPWQLARYYYIKSYISRHRNFNPDSVLMYSDSMMLLVNEYPDDPEMVTYYTNAFFAKAEMNKIKGNYRLAYTYFMEAKKSGQKYDDIDKEACINSNFDYHIGMILYRQEKYQEAANSFISSYNTTTYCDSGMLMYFRLQELLNNIGLCYSKQEKYDSALYYYDRTIDYLDEMEDKWKNNHAFIGVAKGVISGNRAQVYYALGDTVRAIKGLLFNIDINLKSDRELSDALTSVVHLADIYLDAGNVSEAGRWLDTINGILDSVPSENIIKDVYRQKWRYYKLLNRYDSAELYASRYMGLKDSAEVRDRKLQNADVQAAIDAMEKEFELNLLKKNIHARKINTTLVTIAGTLFLMVIIIIVYSWMVSKKKNKILSTQNEQIIEKNNELKKLNENKDRIMAIVAHDLRNPITAIHGLNSILKTFIPAENEEEQEMIRLIETSCNTSLNLISEILLMATINKEDNKWPKETAGLHEFLKSTVGMLRFNANEKQQKLKLDIPPDDAEIKITTEKMRRAIANLVTNAIKFSKPGEEINIKARVNNNRLLMSVSDCGIGIPTHLQPKIFDVFTDAKRLGTSGEKPFGLGLSITRQIIEAHNGRIWFDSEEGRGTTFYMELPVVVPAYQNQY